MSKKTVLALAVAAVMALPVVASAQVGVGVRVGTLGIGGEASIGIGSMFAVRGGIGSTSYHYDGDFNDKQYTVDFPKTIWNVGVDFYPTGGGLRLSAGLLNRKKFDLTGSYTGTTTIGNNTYTGNVKLVGDMKNDKETAPYAAIGFGKTTSKGIGFFLDLGAAMLGDGQITLDGTCTLTTGQSCETATFDADVQAEADKAEADLGGVLKVHPILQIGLKFGF